MRRKFCDAEWGKNLYKKKRMKEKNYDERKERIARGGTCPCVYLRVCAVFFFLFYFVAAMIYRSVVVCHANLSRRRFRTKKTDAHHQSTFDGFCCVVIWSNLKFDGFPPFFQVYRALLKFQSRFFVCLASIISQPSFTITFDYFSWIRPNLSCFPVRFLHWPKHWPDNNTIRQKYPMAMVIFGFFK